MIPTLPIVQYRPLCIIHSQVNRRATQQSECLHSHTQCFCTSVYSGEWVWWFTMLALEDTTKSSHTRSYHVMVTFESSCATLIYTCLSSNSRFFIFFSSPSLSIQWLSSSGRANMHIDGRQHGVWKERVGKIAKGWEHSLCSDGKEEMNCTSNVGYIGT